MARIIAVINQKGGVGKSTCALALGGGLLRRGFKVLFVDLDAQGNLTYTLGADSSDRTSFEVLTQALEAKEAILATDQGDILASSPALSGADAIISTTGKEYRLREALAPLRDYYDFIIIDTPPALGILTVNALTAAGEALVPAQADIYSLQGIGQLHQTIEAVKRYCNPELEIIGIVLTRYNQRSILSRDLMELMTQTAEQLGTRIFSSTIREAVVVREAQAKRRGLYDYAPKSPATADFVALVEEIAPSAKSSGKRRGAK